jgi:hypothetical protein
LRATVCTPPCTKNSYLKKSSRLREPSRKDQQCKTTTFWGRHTTRD